MASLEGARRTLGKYFTDPVVTVLEKTHITPNALTVIGMLITFVAAALVALKHPFAAGWVVLFAGLFDMVDGALARRTNKVSKFGGVLDSTLDRISEASVLIGIAVFYTNHGSVWGVAVAGITLVGSQLPSYIRSKAENLNINGEIGLFTRPERVIILALGLLLADITNVLLIALIVIAVLSFFTAGQRLVHIWNKTKSV
jgi:CDP-diacylglycerol--glycerol-3-phosphate 3-phosphatidyltransferase